MNGLRFAFAGGLTLGLWIALVTLFGYYTGNAHELLRLFAWYPYYSISVMGAGLGFLGGFLEGFFIAGFFAWVYNHIHRYHEK